MQYYKLKLLHLNHLEHLCDRAGNNNYDVSEGLQSKDSYKLIPFECYVHETRSIMTACTCGIKYFLDRCESLKSRGLKINCALCYKGLYNQPAFFLNSWVNSAHLCVPAAGGCQHRGPQTESLPGSALVSLLSIHRGRRQRRAGNYSKGKTGILSSLYILFWTDRNPRSSEIINERQNRKYIHSFSAVLLCWCFYSYLKIQNLKIHKTTPATSGNEHQLCTAF